MQAYFFTTLIDPAHGGKNHQYRQALYVEYVLKPALLWIESIENKTVKEMHNDSVVTILQLLEEMGDVNKTIYESYLFNFIDDYKDNYLEDFSSRLAHDLTRNLEHSEK